MLCSWMVRGWMCRRQFCLVLSLQRRHSTTNIQRTEEPLRILFCGSESFSITALEALNDYKNSAGSNIISIDVATKNDKAGGRGMKEMRSPQIKRAAARLGLRVHQFDTFTGWHLPEYGDSSQPYINLVVAVSFGLLVPPRILSSAKFGGINVHPSMLPDLRGAAPLNWTILRGLTHTGVTVQTLHPSKFDHGHILAQTPMPGIAIPDPDRITAHELRLMLAPIGADLLVDVVRNKTFLQSNPIPQSAQSSNPAPHLTFAPKIVPSMRILDPFTDNLSAVLKKNRAIPKLWAEAQTDEESGTRTKRIIFGTSIRAATMEDLPRGEAQKIVEDIPTGVPFTLAPTGEDIRRSKLPLYLKVKDGSILTIPALLAAGAPEGPAAASAAHAKLFAEPALKDLYEVYQFRSHLTASTGNS